MFSLDWSYGRHRISLVSCWVEIVRKFHLVKVFRTVVNNMKVCYNRGITLTLKFSYDV